MQLPALPLSLIFPFVFPVRIFHDLQSCLGYLKTMGIDKSNIYGVCKQVKQTAQSSRQHPARISSQHSLNLMIKGINLSLGETGGPKGGFSNPRWGKGPWQSGELCNNSSISGPTWKLKVKAEQAPKWYPGTEDSLDNISMKNNGSHTLHNTSYWILKFPPSPWKGVWELNSFIQLQSPFAIIAFCQARSSLFINPIDILNHPVLHNSVVLLLWENTEQQRAANLFQTFCPVFSLAHFLWNARNDCGDDNLWGIYLLTASKKYGQAALLPNSFQDKEQAVHFHLQCIKHPSSEVPLV